MNTGAVRRMLGAVALSVTLLPHHVVHGQTSHPLIVATTNSRACHLLPSAHPASITLAVFSAGANRWTGSLHYADGSTVLTMTAISSVRPLPPSGAEIQGMGIYMLPAASAPVSLTVDLTAPFGHRCGGQIRVYAAGDGINYDSNARPLAEAHVHL